MVDWERRALLSINNEELADLIMAQSIIILLLCLFRLYIQDYLSLC